MDNQNTAQYVIELAKKHNISYDENLELSKLGKKMIELSDDEYFLNDIDELVVALAEAGIISVKDGGELIYKLCTEHICD